MSDEQPDARHGSKRGGLGTIAAVSIGLGAGLVVLTTLYLIGISGLLA